MQNTDTVSSQDINKQTKNKQLQIWSCQSSYVYENIKLKVKGNLFTTGSIKRNRKTNCLQTGLPNTSTGLSFSENKESHPSNHSISWTRHLHDGSLKQIQ